MASSGNHALARAPQEASSAALVASFESTAVLRAKPKQVRAMRAIVQRFMFQARLAHPRQISTAAVQDYLAALLMSGRSPKTVHNHASAISTFCEFLDGRIGLKPNPVLAVRLPELEERLPLYLTPAEIQTALAVARESGCYAEICLCMATGLRRGEMTRLNWSDVDLERKQLHVRKSKGKRPRTVPLNRPALEALRKQMGVSGTMAYVFPARKTFRGGFKWVDKPRAEKTWRTLFLPVQDAVPKFKQAIGTGRMYHTLRHTFGSRGAQNNVSLYKLAKWMGHRDIRTTEIYAHLADNYDEDIEAAAPF